VYPADSRLPASTFNDNYSIHTMAFRRHERVHSLFLPVHSHRHFRFFATNEIDADKSDDDDSEDESDSPYHSKWIVPAGVFIPEEQLKIKYVRSSGAGGQNVNKVSSCVQVRFHVLSAEWMGPYEVRDRFMQAYKNQINRDGIYQTESQAHRTQYQNRKDVLQKIEQAVLAVWPRPKLRRVRVGLSEKGERKRKEEKEKQSAKKGSRRNVRYDF
jgi:protein subunit release factor B